MSKLILTFENDEQREEFTGWFADGGGEQYFYESYKEQTGKRIDNDLIFKNSVVKEIDFKEYNDLIFKNSVVKEIDFKEYEDE